MWPVIGGMMSGLGSLVSGWLSSDTSAQNTQANIQAQQQMQAQTQQFNAAEAEKNRAFQEHMSSSAYTRARDDMLAAGLNPASMFGHGGAESTPGGATASVSSPNMALSQRQNPLQGLGDMANRFVTTAVNVESFDKLKEEIANLKVERAKQQATTELIERQKTTEEKRPAQVVQETSTSKQVEALQEIITRLRRLEEPGAQVKATEQKGVQSLGETVLKGGGILDYITGKAGGVLDTVTGTAKRVWDMLPKRSTRQQSGTDSKGHEYDRFEDVWTNRTGWSR